MKLIDKDALVAEIKVRNCMFLLETYNKGYANGDDLHDLNTLGVKEVDLEKELSVLDRTLFDLDGVAVAGSTHYLTVEDVKDIAKHFFELGLKTQKGE